MKPLPSVRDDALIAAERVGQLGPQSVAVQSVGELIGGLSIVAGKGSRTFVSKAVGAFNGS